MERLINHVPVRSRVQSNPSSQVGCAAANNGRRAQVRNASVMGRLASPRISSRRPASAGSDPFTEMQPARRPLKPGPPTNQQAVVPRRTRKDPKQKRNDRACNDSTQPARPTKAAKTTRHSAPSEHAGQTSRAGKTRQRTTLRRAAVAVNYSEKAQQHAACGRGDYAKDQRPDESGVAYARRLTGGTSSAIKCTQSATHAQTDETQQQAIVDCPGSTDPSQGQTDAGRSEQGISIFDFHDNSDCESLPYERRVSIEFSSTKPKQPASTSVPAADNDGEHDDGDDDAAAVAACSESNDANLLKGITGRIEQVGTTIFTLCCLFWIWYINCMCR